MSSKIINSVGIDVGTTTTQIIFSQLELVNIAAISQVPNYEFIRKDVMYFSPVIFTPVDFEGNIRVQELKQFIDMQYAQAGFSISDVESGAIIITGETLKAKNARTTVMGLSEELGDFVVATAGPHLESVISGHGSGAADYSKQHSDCVLNIDIGGGTSNYAVFEAGKLVDTACLNVGGHLVELGADGQVSHLHKPAKLIFEDCFPEPVTRLNAVHIDAIAQRMAQLIVEVIEGNISSLARSLLMTPELKKKYSFNAIFISGGVGECYYRTGLSNFGDIGPQLAASLHQNDQLQQMPVMEPRHTLRATVIGAGVHTLSLSGSTIWLNFGTLPIRNVPVLHPLGNELDTPQQLIAAWKASATAHDIVPDMDCYALSIPALFPVSYKSVQFCSTALRLFMEQFPNSFFPLIITAKQNFGMALGMELQPFMQHRELVVIDEVETREWDYIDIGKGLFGDTVVPLTIKSLAFSS